MKGRVLLILMLVFTLSGLTAGELKLRTNGDAFLPNSRLGVRVTQKDVTETLIAVFKDGSQILEQYPVVVNGEEVNFTTPEKQGSYEVALVLPDSPGAVLEKKSITVHYILTDKLKYAPNEPMKVYFSTMNPEFQEGSWVGMFTADIPKLNGEDVRDHFIVEGIMDLKREDVLEFDAPSKPGTYHLRAYTSMDPTGYEISRIVFQVMPLEPVTSLSASKKVLKVGERFHVTYKTNVFLRNGTWFGFVTPDVPHNDQVASSENNSEYGYPFSYVGMEDTEGVVEMEAPSKPGTYEVRFFDSNVDDALELGYLTLEVTW
ncbi:hypothetical protein JXR74_07235 [Candidatus Mcinerneyibacteriota bacterium]|nr:hypothetical protein [Candidatus Mcinerneyibacteriota bacterium]